MVFKLFLGKNIDKKKINTVEACIDLVKTKSELKRNS